MVTLHDVWMYCSKGKRNNRQVTLLRGNLLIIHQPVSGETCHETYFLRFYRSLIGYDQQRTVFAHDQLTFIDELLLELFYIGMSNEKKRGRSPPFLMT